MKEAGFWLAIFLFFVLFLKQLLRFVPSEFIHYNAFVNCLPTQSISFDFQFNFLFRQQGKRT